MLEIIPDCDVYDEDKYTIKYMEKYGINNVRGGSFCQIRLSDNNLITLNQMIIGVSNKCYICGSNTHFACECKTVSVKPAKIPTININEKYILFSSHRRGKCALNRVLSYFDDEDNI